MVNKCTWCGSMSTATRGHICAACVAWLERTQLMPCICLICGSVYRIKDAQGAPGGPSHGYCTQHEGVAALRSVRRRRDRCPVTMWCLAYDGRVTDDIISNDRPQNGVGEWVRV